MVVWLGWLYGGVVWFINIVQLPNGLNRTKGKFFKRFILEINNFEIKQKLTIVISTNNTQVLASFKIIRNVNSQP